MAKRIKSIAIVLIVLTGLVLGLLVGLAHLYKEEIIAQVLDAVNEQVDVPIDVKEIDFSLIHDFPNASVMFSDVFIADRLNQEDTLLHTELLTLEFDVWDMLQQRYTITKASVNKGDIHMYRRADGELNYVFWKSSDKKETDISLAIDQLELSQVKYSYRDEVSDVDLQSELERLGLKGVFGQEDTHMNLDFTGTQSSIKVNDIAYIEQNDMAFEGKVDILQSGQDLIFSDAVARVAEVRIPILGRIFKQEDWNIDLTLDGSLDMAELRKALPNQYRKNLDQYALSGEADFLMKIQGPSTDKLSPAIDLAFDVNGAELKLVEASTAIRNIRSKGRYTRSAMGQDKVSFAQFSGTMPEGEIAYTGLISDFDHPYVDGRLACRSDLVDVLSLVEQNVIIKPSGRVNFDFQVKGPLPIGEIDLRAMNKLSIQGQAALSSVAFGVASNGYACAGINTSLKLDDDILHLDTTSMVINGDALVLAGELHGLWPYLLSENGVLKLKAHAHSPSIDWNRWAIASLGQDGSATELPRDIVMDIDFGVDRFQYRAFTAQELSGSFGLEQAQIALSELQLRSCEGRLEASLDLTQAQDLSWKLNSRAKIKGVDIHQLFGAFEQFGQSFIEDHHLAGHGDAQIAFKSSMNEDMEMDLKSIVSEAQITLRDGELIAHPAMSDMIDALRERNMLKAFVRADELAEEVKHLRFSTLENSIHIAHGQIEIPAMRIATNALEIGISGVHGFDSNIDYAVDFSLRDILVNKQNPDFYIEDDGLGHVIHVRMYGNTDNPSIELDKGATREKRQEAIAEAKSEIKTFFKNPFGKGEVDKKDDRSAAKVVIETGDSEQEDNDSATEPSDEPKKKRKRWKFLEGDDSEESQEGVTGGDDF